MYRGQPIESDGIRGGAVRLYVRDRILRGVGKCYIVSGTGHSAISECGYTSVNAFFVLQEIQPCQRLRT